MGKHQDSIVLMGDNPPIRKFFQGELMTCAICGKQKKSDPDVESNWTIIEVNGKTLYICPGELPLNNPRATQGDFNRAYRRIFRKLGITNEV